jgi:hypothetical protein
MSNINFHYQPLEYLAATVAENGNTGEQVVVLTIRPDPNQFRPHNIGISQSQAQRLLQDLQQILAATTLLLVLLLGTGCSSKVDVSTERSANSESTAVEKFHTKVEIDLENPPKQTPQPPSPSEQLPVPPKATGKAVQVEGIAMIVEGDLHFHEHLHLEAHPSQERSAPNRNRSGPRRSLNGSRSRSTSRRSTPSASGFGGNMR